MSISDAERAALRKEFDRAFHTVGLMHVWVDDLTHEVNVKAYAISLKVKKRIPIKMGVVMGRFNCDKCELDTLENAPHTVSDNFSCHSNYLTSLVGGPQSVGSHSMGGGTYSCSHNFLKNFEGAPTAFTGYFVGVGQMGTGLDSVTGLPPDARQVDITYQNDLPMLKLLNQKSVHVRQGLTSDLHPITDILEKYKEQGKPGALKAAAELVRAGYKDNARW
jgi:hypothetical protein